MKVYTNKRHGSTMRTALIAILLCLPLMSMAKDKVDDTPYLAGAVPERDGIVTFRASFGVDGKQKSDIYQTMKAYAQSLVENSIPAPGNYARFTQDTQDTICVRICEWIEFKRKPLVLDRARLRYQMVIFCQEGKVRMEMSQLNYYYDENMEGEGGYNIHAEEWITDQYALNKSKTKLLPKSGKFRRKTVDRMNELIESAMSAFEQEEKIEIQVKKPEKKAVRILDE